MLKTKLGASPITVGNHTYGLEGMEVFQWDEGMPLVIGNYCSIAIGVEILLGGQHRADWTSMYPFGHTVSPGLSIPPVKGHPHSKGGVTIGSDVWIGRKAKILNGVIIGNGAVIGSFSVVSRDVPPYAIVAGNPARVKKFRFDTEIIDLLEQLRWYDLPDDVVNKIYLELCKPPTKKHLETLITQLRK